MQASKFAVGQKVRVIRARGGEGLVQDAIVTVTSAGVDRYEPRVYVDGLTNNMLGYDDSRFELVEDYEAIKVGSKVRIVNSDAKDYDANGMGRGKEWHNSWNREMRGNVGNGKVYTVSHIACQGVRFKEISFNYPLTALELVSDLNGVDGNGQPVKFATSDLKTLQRVVFRNGKKGIVSVVQEGFLRVITDDEDHVKARMSYELERIGGGTSYDIVEVYDLPPMFRHGFKFDQRGKLLFKAIDAAKVEAQKAADKAVAEAKAALEKAEAARKALN